MYLFFSLPSRRAAPRSFNPFVHWKEDPAYLEQLKGELERAVDKIAERKYKGFNQSISSFTAILKQFTAAQNTFARLQQQVSVHALQ